MLKGQLLAFVMLLHSCLGVTLAAELPEVDPISLGAIALPQNFSSKNICVSGNRAYVASGREIHIIDISDLKNPQILAVRDVGRTTYQIQAAGNFLYAPLGSYGFQIYEISPAYELIARGRYTRPSTTFYSVQLVGGHAYVGTTTGLYALDITNPMSPTIYREMGGAGSVQDTAVVGRFVYVASFNLGLMIYEITATGVQSRGRFNTSSARSVDVDPPYAYLTTDNGFQVINVSNPAAPASVASMAYTGQVTVNSGRAFLNGGSTVIDVTDPARPKYLGGYHHPGTTESASVGTVLGRYGFLVFQSPAGFSIIDVNRPANPQTISSIAVEGEPYRTAISGNYAYVASTYFGVTVVDISDKTTPRVVAQKATAGPARDVVVSGNYLFVAAHEPGFEVFDITNPIQPVSVRIRETGGQTVDLDLAGSHLFVGNGNGLVVFDVTNPAEPRPVGQILNGADAFLIRGNYAYSAASSGLSITITDITNPARMRTVGMTDTSYSGNDLAISPEGDYVYIAGSQGLDVIDVRDPARPWKIGNYGDRTVGVTRWGNYLYVTDNLGLQVYELSDPAVPRHLAENRNGRGAGITIANNLLYIADEQYRFRILDLYRPLHVIAEKRADGIAVKFDGPRRSPLILQRSADFRNWQSLDTQTPGDAPALYLETGSAPSRFYRALQE